MSEQEFIALLKQAFPDIEFVAELRSAEDPRNVFSADYWAIRPLSISNGSCMAISSVDILEHWDYWVNEIAEYLARGY